MRWALLATLPTALPLHQTTKHDMLSMTVLVMHDAWQAECGLQSEESWVVVAGNSGDGIFQTQWWSVVVSGGYLSHTSPKTCCLVSEEHIWFQRHLHMYFFCLTNHCCCSSDSSTAPNLHCSCLPHFGMVQSERLKFQMRPSTILHSVTTTKHLHVMTHAPDDYLHAKPLKPQMPVVTMMLCVSEPALTCDAVPHLIHL